MLSMFLIYQTVLNNMILLSFAENKNKLETYKKELEEIDEKLRSLNQENNSSAMFNLSLQQKIWDFDNKKKLIEEEIYKIENNVDENNYMLKTGKLLHPS